MYKNFLDKRGKDYQQVLLTDTRDVICQADIFKIFENHKSYLAYATEGAPIRNQINPANYNWLTHLFGKEQADRLADKEIICAGTILGSTNEIKNFLEKIIQLLKNKVVWGDDQAATNYLIYENKLGIKNLIKLDCWHGDIFSVTFFHINIPPRIQNNKILRGDGGVPAVVHQYPCFRVFVELIEKIYRDKNFQLDEKFSDTRSILEQIFYLATIGKIDDAYKFFTKHLFGKNLSEFEDRLIKLWELIFTPNQTPIPAIELLTLSIQTALISNINKQFTIQEINKIYTLVNFSMKNNRLVILGLKLFLGNILFKVANDLYHHNQLEQCLSCLENIATLDIPLNESFYIFKAEVYRKLGRKDDALTAYEKALNM